MDPRTSADVVAEARERAEKWLAGGVSSLAVAGFDIAADLLAALETSEQERAAAERRVAELTETRTVSDDDHMVVYWFCDSIDRYAADRPQVVAREARKVLPKIRAILAERVAIGKLLASPPSDTPADTPEEKS